MDLSRLRKKRAKRRRKVEHHTRKYHFFKNRGKRGDKVRMRYHRARIKSNKKAVAKLNRLIKRQKDILWGMWGGCRLVIEDVIIPLVEKHRGPGKVGSRKRPANHSLSRSNPGSDHNEANRNADAVDFLLVDDADMARRIYAALTGELSQNWPGDYANFYFVYRGRRFRCQLIARQHGTGPHLHVGLAS